MVYLLHNSHDYYDKKPIEFPLIVWILFGIITLIPILNCIATVIYIIHLAVGYSENIIEFNNEFWLGKKY